MRTEDWAQPRRAVRFRRALVGAVALLSVAGSLTAAAAPTDSGPPWMDAEAAARELVDAHIRLLRANEALTDAGDELAALIDTQSLTADDTLVIASELQEVRETARDLVIEAYVSGGAVSDALYILDSQTANDFAYRLTIVNEGTAAVARSQSVYISKHSQATADVVDLADRIDAMDGAIEVAEREIVAAERAIPAAEWVLEVAQIHQRADGFLERFSRVDPAPEQWAELRHCESTSVYSTQTGNGFYGAYQFTARTWVRMGGKGLASEATPEEQDARARLLYAMTGSGYGRGGSWPKCGVHLP